MSDAETLPRLPKPESLEAKFKLLALLPYDRRAKRKHSLLLAFILDWFHSKYGDALASVRHIVATIKERDPAGRGLFSGDVHSALADLVAWGYLSQEKGSGRRASRYVPNWSLVCSVRENQNATDDAHSVLKNPNASVREIQNTTADSVRDIQNEDPSYGTRSQDQGTEIDGKDCAAPTAPPVAGLSAATAGTAQDDFEKLWRAYDYKRNKREARAAFRKLAQDADLVSTMIDAATAWRAAWAAQGNTSAPRYRLDKWLEREEYECQPPTGYTAKVRKPKAANDNAKPDRSAPRAPFAEIREVLTVTGTKVVSENGDTTLTIDVVNEAGEEKDIPVHLEARLESVQAEGQRTLTHICQAVGIQSIADSKELHGLRFSRTWRGRSGGYEYEPAPQAAAA